MRQYAHQPGADSDASGNCSPTLCVEGRKGCTDFCILTFDWYLNETESLFLWSMEMPHSSVTGAVGALEVLMKTRDG